ncbi:MAG: HEAT repeat domain-containing protein [Syntrophobacteraceae bacterium]
MRAETDNLLRVLASSDEAERLYAVQDLAEMRDPDSVNPLVQTLVAEESRVIRDAIVFGLRNMPCFKAYDSLFDLFCSSDAYLRNAAITIFGSREDGATAFLASHLDHSDREVRKLIIDALFQIGSSDAVLAIRACLHDTAPNVQITAVEYLGRLCDEASLEEMLEIFNAKSEPMLRTSLLESFSLMGDSAPFPEVLAVLAPDDDFSRIDPVYIPQILDLACRVGSPEQLRRLINSIEETSVYADDIMRAVSHAKSRHKDLFLSEEIFRKIVRIAGDRQVREDVRYAAVGCILGRDCGLSGNEALYFLGIQLASEESMVYAGVKILSCCGGDRGERRIRSILKDTKDEELRALCLELVGE